MSKQDDIESSKAVIVLLILTILVSIVGTLTIVSQPATAERVSTAGFGSGKVLVKIVDSPEVASPVSMVGDHTDSIEIVPAQSGGASSG